VKKPKLSTDSITSIETASTSVANNPDTDSSLSFSWFDHKGLLEFVLDCVLMQGGLCHLSLCVSMICFYLTSQEID